MNIKQKLSGVFSIMILIVLLVGAIGGYEVHVASKNYQNLLNGRVQTILAIKDLRYMAGDQTKYLRGYLLTGDANQLEMFKQNKEKLIADMATMQQQLADDSTTIKMLQELSDLETQYGGITDQLITYKQQNNVVAYTKMVQEQCVPMALSLADKAQQMEEYHSNLLKEAQVETNNDANVTLYTLMVISVIAVIVGIVIAYFVIRMFSKPIALVAEGAKEIAQGNLTIDDLHISSKDELGQMANSFNEMKNNLRGLMQVIGSSAEQMAAASEELTATSEESVKTADEATVTVKGISSSAGLQLQQVMDNQQLLEKNTNNIYRIAESVALVADSSSKALNDVKYGESNVEQTVLQMKNVDQTVQATATALYELAEQSKEIATIVQVIRDIAGQTNLLSLNASIEAARAGEHGLGFAVVASEVKKLSEYSNDSARQINDKIEDIIQRTSHAVSKMEEGAKEVQSGTKAVQQMGDIFHNVHSAIQLVTEQVKEVSTASNQISSGSSKILDSERQIAGLSQQITSDSKEATQASTIQLESMREISNAAESLSHLSMDLQTEVSKFRV